MHEWLCVYGAAMRRKKGHVVWRATWLARRAEVVELVRLGYNYRTIARTKRVSLGFVAAAVKRYKQTKSHCDRPRSGGPRKVTPRVETMTRTLLHNTKVSSVWKVRAKLRGKGIDLSRGTVHNIAHRRSMRSAVRIPKPKLTPEHRAARLAWVNTRMGDDEKTIQNWSSRTRKGSWSTMLHTVFGFTRTSRHLFVKHVSIMQAIHFLFFLPCPPNTLLAAQHHAAGTARRIHCMHRLSSSCFCVAACFFLVL